MLSIPAECSIAFGVSLISSHYSLVFPCVVVVSCADIISVTHAKAKKPRGVIYPKKGILIIGPVRIEM